MGVFKLDLSRVVTTNGGITTSSLIRCIGECRTIIHFRPSFNKSINSFQNKTLFMIWQSHYNTLSVGTTTRWNRYS